MAESRELDESMNEHQRSVQAACDEIDRLRAALRTAEQRVLENRALLYRCAGMLEWHINAGHVQGEDAEAVVVEINRLLRAANP